MLAFSSQNSEMKNQKPLQNVILDHFWHRFFPRNKMAFLVPILLFLIQITITAPLNKPEMTSISIEGIPCVSYPDREFWRLGGGPGETAGTGKAAAPLVGKPKAYGKCQNYPFAFHRLFFFEEKKTHNPNCVLSLSVTPPHCRRVGGFSM